MKMQYVIAKEFGRTPSARKEEEGKLSGRELRAILVPLIKKAIERGVCFSIDMDGTAGYGTSFLEEVFGGLIRNADFTLKELEQCLTIKSEEDPDLTEAIWGNIKDAEEERISRR